MNGQLEYSTVVLFILIILFGLLCLYIGYKYAENIFKPKEPCPKCKGSGEILVPVTQIGSFIEYDSIQCECKKK